MAKAIFDLNKQTAVLLINGRPLSINYLAEKAPAIIEGWYLGQEQGIAVANVIFGKVNPGGKLAVTIPRHVGQLSVYYNRKPYVHESPYITGEYSPLYPFGFGLSYTQYQYANLRLNTKKIIAGAPVSVTIDIANTGDRDGDEIVQLYIRDMVISVTRPLQELKDFARIHLKKGETKTVSFIITSDKLQYYGLDMKRIIEPGEFEVQVGKNSTARHDYENFRIVMVSYYGALEFCSWAGGSLPTEVEWCYAAGGGVKSKHYLFAGGNNYEKVGWFKANSEGRLHRTGEKNPNELGIYDMSGNAWEWCLNNILTGDTSFCVHMGGSWYAGEEPGKLDAHYGNTPTHFSNSVGCPLF